MTADKLNHVLGLLDAWVESNFKRVPKGRAGGGQFAFKGGKAKPAAAARVKANKPATFKVQAAKKAWEGIHARRAAAKGAAAPAGKPATAAPKKGFVPPSWAKTGAAGTATRFRKRQRARQLQQAAAQREEALKQPARKVQTWRKKAALKAWEKIRAKREAAKAAGGVKPVPVRPAPKPAAAPAPEAKHVHGKFNAQQREQMVREHITSHDVKERKHQDGGINKFDFIVFDDGHLGGFKPADGEAEGWGWRQWLAIAKGGVIEDRELANEIMAIPESRRDREFINRDRPRIPRGMQTEREAAAWEVAKLVGMDDLATPCVAGKIGGAYGAAMEIQPGVNAYKAPAGKEFDGDEHVRRAAMFDYILGNSDRHGGNWMIDGDEMKLIDHGLCLPEATHFADGANMELMDHAHRLEMKGQKGSPAQYAKTYADKKNDIKQALVKLGFNDKVIHGAMQRIDRAQHAKRWGDLNAFAKQPGAKAQKVALTPPGVPDFVPKKAAPANPRVSAMRRELL
jgi:hypothetical protein